MTDGADGLGRRTRGTRGDHVSRSVSLIPKQHEMRTDREENH